ncbi:hypothetical protein Tco_0033788 [Tanacetum coccineum]
MCHIIGIEPQFENIISNGPCIPMAAGQRKPEIQWTPDERKAANLDQRLKRLIMSVLPDDQINSVINCLTAKSTWDDLILYHEGPSDVKESRVMDLKLCYNTFKFKEDETLTQTFTRYKALMNELVNDGIKLPKLEINSGFINSHDDEEDARSSQEYMNDLEEKYQARDLLAKSKRFFKKGTQTFSGAKATDQTECHKCAEKLALLSSSASASNSSLGKNKGVIAKTYEWDEEEVSSDENEGIEVKALMALTDEERVSVGKESASNSEWVKISIQKVHTLLEMEDNDDRKSFLDYLCIDLNYVEEQRNNLLLKHRYLVQELNTCKEQLLVLKQAKLDLLTMQHCISEQIPTQKKKILGIDQLTEDTSSSWPKDLVFVKSSADNSNVSITSSNKTRLSKAEDSTLPNHDTADESSVYSTPLPPLEKLAGAKPISGPKTIKSILKSKFTFKDETLKGIIINEPSSSPAKGNISTSVNQHHTGQGESSSRSRPSRLAIPSPSCIHCGYNDHQFDDCIYYPIRELCGSYDHDTHGHNKIISLGRGIKARNPQHVTKNCETCGSNVHTTTDHNDIEWFRKREALQDKKAETFKTSKIESSNALRSNTPTKRWVSKQN